MKTKLFLVLTVFCCVVSANAQERLIKGYYITYQKDTVNVIFLNTSDNNSKNQFEYKKSENESQYSILTTDEAVKVHIGDDLVFVNRSIDYSFQNNEIKNQKTFLKVLVEGTLSLLQYDHSSKIVYYFLDKKDIGIREIKSAQSTRLDQFGNRILVEDSGYKTILNFYTQDCENMVIEITKLTFNITNIANVITNYNNCKGDENQIYLLKQPKVKIVPSIIVSGVSYTQDLDDNLNRFNAEFENAFNYRISAFANLKLLNKSKNPVGFLLGVSYLPTPNFANDVRCPDGSNTCRIDTKFDFVSLNLIPHITFINSNKISLQLGVGPDFSFIIKEPNFILTNNDGTKREFIGSGQSTPRKNSTGFIVNQQIKYNINKSHLVFDLNYINSQYFITGVGSNFRSNYFVFGLGFEFNN